MEADIILTPAKFRNLSEDKKQKLVNAIKVDYLDNNMKQNEISIKYDINIGCLKYIVKTYSLKKDRKQVAINVQKTLLCRTPEEKLKSKLKYQNTCKNFSSEKKLEIRNKIEKTNLEKYGVKYPAQNKEIHNKMEQTCLDKYGTKNPYQNEQIKNKISSTKFIKYNDKQFINSSKIKNTWNNKSKDEINIINQKRINTNLKRYGFENPYKDSEFMKSTYINKFGIDHPWKSKDVRYKISKTIQEKYGVPYYCMTDECKEAQGHVISKINKKFAKLLLDNNIPFEQEYIINNRSYDFKNK